jgi:hypothetical protein
VRVRWSYQTRTARLVHVLELRNVYNVSDVVHGSYKRHGRLTNNVPVTQWRWRIGQPGCLHDSCSDGGTGSTRGPAGGAGHANHKVRWQLEICVWSPESDDCILRSLRHVDVDDRMRHHVISLFGQPSRQTRTTGPCAWQEGI